MKNKKQLIELFNALDSAKNKSVYDFKKVVIKNKMQIQPEIDLLGDLEKMIHDERKKIVTERNEITVKHSEVDVIDGKEVRVIKPENKEAFITDVTKFEADNKKRIEALEKLLSDHDDELKSPCNEYTFLQVDESMCNELTGDELEDFMLWELLK